MDSKCQSKDLVLDFSLERVSWYCRDHKLPSDSGNGGAEIFFSNRSGMNYQEMKEYFNHLKVQTKISDIRIDWNLINPESIYAYSPGKLMGLQIADAVASSFYYAVQPSRYDYTEHRYACMLKPVVYHRQGRYVGYGLKFWPRELDEMLVDDERLKWVKENY